MSQPWHISLNQKKYQWVITYENDAWHISMTYGKHRWVMAHKLHIKESRHFCKSGVSERFLWIQTIKFPTMIIFLMDTCWCEYVKAYSNLVLVRSSPKLHVQKAAFLGCMFLMNKCSLRLHVPYEHMCLCLIFAKGIYKYNRLHSLNVCSLWISILYNYMFLRNKHCCE